jgi:hypothetical protein
MESRDAVPSAEDVVRIDAIRVLEGKEERSAQSGSGPTPGTG